MLKEFASPNKDQAADEDEDADDDDKKKTGSTKNK